MDEFAKEYFKKLQIIASDFEDKRPELAKSRIKMFSAAIARQLLEFGETFDLLMGAGNSGLFMTKIAEMIYEHLSLKTPTVLNLPIYRFKEDNTTINNSSQLVSRLKQTLKNLEVNNILFVDDEIMRALTVKECFNLILKANPNINHLTATIIAENHFFEWHYKMPKVSISFFAYSPLIQGLNGNIGYFIPEELHKEICLILDKTLSHNHTMALVVGDALKQKDENGNSYFDYAIESNLKNKIVNYANKKSSLMTELKELVKNGIEKYKEGEIKFRF